MSGVEIRLGRKTGHRRRKAAFRMFVLLFIAALAIACGYYSYTSVMDKNEVKDTGKAVDIDPEKGITVEIPRGAGTETIANLLKEKGIIKYPYLFKILSMVNGYDGTYQSGTHIVSSDLKYEDIMRVLSSKPVSIKVTIPEGYTFDQIVEVLSKNKLINADEFRKVANTGKFDYEFLKDLPEREDRLEGYLFPDTYEFDVNAKPEDIINTFLRNFKLKFKPEYLEKAEKMDMSVDKIITLASIIEREARLADERDTIAGVFYNRLRSKDKTLRRLQSCATIQYIFFKREGIIKEQITEADTLVDSPYNTYQIEGLPPGPICNPGEDAIKAALFPEETDFLYFVARGDGSHQFSKTFAEHQAAMKKYGVN